MHDEDVVHVGHQHLLEAGLRRVAPRQGVGPRQDLPHERAQFGVLPEEHPVAGGGRHLGLGPLRVGQRPGHAGGSGHVALAPVDADDPAERPVAGGLAAAPAVVVEVDGHVPRW